MLFLFVSCQQLQISSHALLLENEKIDLNNKNLKILSYCEFYDLDGQFFRGIPGTFCAPFKNGKIAVSSENQLKFYDEKNKILWVKDEFVHHQLKVGVHENTILAITSNYKVIDDKKYRQDNLVVYDLNGQLQKKFSFNENTEGFNYRDLTELKETWSSENNGLSYEKTHFNSFYEILKKENNQITLIGYIANEKQHRKIYQFNSDLTKIVRTIKTDGHAHDASFLNQDKIIYYANFIASENFANNAVAIYDLNQNTFQYVYRQRDGILKSIARGSVQPIGDNKFLISHSPEKVLGYFEIIDLSGQVLKKAILRRAAGLYVQGALLQDFSDFFKNNTGN
jgi:hypothetical protein